MGVFESSESENMRSNLGKQSMVPHQIWIW